MESYHECLIFATDENAPVFPYIFINKNEWMNDNVYLLFRDKKKIIQIKAGIEIYNNKLVRVIKANAITNLVVI